MTTQQRKKSPTLFLVQSRNKALYKSAHLPQALPRLHFAETLQELVTYQS